jgi:hypothetical protein
VRSSLAREGWLVGHLTRTIDMEMALLLAETAALRNDHTYLRSKSAIKSVK